MIDREAIRRMHRHAEARRDRHPVVVLADNVDKASNLGSILRTAEAFRCERVITNRSEVDAAGAMGAQHWQPVEWGSDLVTRVTEYRTAGYSIVALEQSELALPLDTFVFAERTGLIVGAEAFGVSEELTKLADSIVYIPHAGLVKSLNVATATGIALYEYSRQHWMRGFSQPGEHLGPALESLRLHRRDAVAARARG